MLEPGRYIATVDDYGIRTVGEKNTAQLSIKFKTKEGGKSVFFQNFLTENTVKTDYFKNLMDTLVGAGVLKSKRFTDISKGKDFGALSTSVEVEIVVDHQRDENGQLRVDKKGEPYVAVSFVNDPSRSGMKGKLAEAEAVTVLAGLNLDAHILEAQQRVGVTISEDLETNTDDVPF